MEEADAVKIEGEDFYERIEAPKFVDFTAPDHYRPDDRYWFCLRAGCDQKHEEEMDSEAIYKNFVLRVMAARSPNVRLCKAPSASLKKCPLTAPAKSSKSRVSRLALISSISKKRVDPKVKPKLVIDNATPIAKAKLSSSIAKALTTPRNRKGLPNPDNFRSVRNPKSTQIAVPTNRVVAKALVFHSPKKVIRTKVSREWNTPVRTLSSALKKLEIRNGQRNVIGNEKPLTLDASRRKLRGREVKSRVFDSLNSHGRKGHVVKSSRTLKRESPKEDCSDSTIPERFENDSSDMEIDEKSRKGSIGGQFMSNSSKTGGQNGSEENSEIVEISESSSSEHTVNSSGTTETCNGSSLSSFEEKHLRDNNVNEYQIPSEADNKKNGRDELKDKIKSSTSKGKIMEPVEKANKENTVASDDNGNDNEIIENDGKENALASNGNREPKNLDSERVILGKPETSKKTLKVKQGHNKTLKDNSTSAGLGTEAVMKYRKPKPTNPRPFRLRTDERRILKEANSEKKVNGPLKEITSITGVQGGKLEKEHQNMTQKNESCVKVHERVNLDEESYQKKSDRKIQNEQPETVDTTTSMTPKREAGKKLSTTTPRKCHASMYKKHTPVTSQLEQCKDKVTEKSEDSLTKTKPQKMQQKSMRPWDASSKTEAASPIMPGHLGVKKEARKPFGTGGAGSSSRGRRPATIPKEPNFHRIHVPKSCTRKLAEAML